MSKVAANKSAILARIPLACSDEALAVAFFEEQRWGDSPACPRCGDMDVKQMKSKDGTRNARFLWRCYGCKQQFTVKIGTVMEDSPIPVRHWCLAFYRAASSKKGISALQIQRETGLSYKSALFMMARIRWAMAPVNAGEPKLGVGGGIVEYDETYVGGKPRRIPLDTRNRRKRGPKWDFSKRKTPVVAGVERDGQVKAQVVDSVTFLNLHSHVREMVDKAAHLMTDERRSYIRVGREYASHQTVKHSLGEYVRGDVSTNRIEGFFAGLKRQIGGTHHSVSKKHLHRYLAETVFKYNYRALDDGERTVRGIQGADCKRLTYKQYLGRA